MNYAYLQPALWNEEGVRTDLDQHVDVVARAWLATRVDAPTVELISEHLARLAKELGDHRVANAQVVASLAHLAPAPDVLALLNAAPLNTAKDLFALAIHVVDIAERMAQLTYLAELPAMTSQAMRTGDAARNVGLARHLKG